MNMPFYRCKFLTPHTSPFTLHTSNIYKPGSSICSRESDGIGSQTQEETRIRVEQERIQRQQAEDQKRQELLRAQVARMQQEREEKRRREEEARIQAQQQKISHT